MATSPSLETHPAPSTVNPKPGQLPQPGPSNIVIRTPNPLLPRRTVQSQEQRDCGRDREKESLQIQREGLCPNPPCLSNENILVRHYRSPVLVRPPLLQQHSRIGFRHVRVALLYRVDTLLKPSNETRRRTHQHKSIEHTRDCERDARRPRHRVQIQEGKGHRQHQASNREILRGLAVQNIHGADLDIQEVSGSVVINLC